MSCITNNVNAFCLLCLHFLYVLIHTYTCKIHSFLGVKSDCMQYDTASYDWGFTHLHARIQNSTYLVQNT